MVKNIAAGVAGALGGTMAACHVGTAAPRVFAIVVGGLMLLATAINLATIPHPLWFSIAGIAGIIFAAWLGMFLSKKANGT
jgi:glucose dehydrogenase